MRRGVAIGVLIGAIWSPLGVMAAEGFSDTERTAIQRFGPWPPAPTLDPTNRLDGDRAAIMAGRSLFDAPGLSAAGDLACSACHRPALAFSDGLKTGQAARPLDRNTPSLWNVAQQRWYGWGGANDTLWGASIRPIVKPDEMASSEAVVVQVLTRDGSIGDAYRAAFGPVVREMALANVGKALAAYQATLTSPPTSFDRFRDALAVGDADGIAAYPESAKRGLKLFIGRGNCALCHSGARFSNGEFDDVAVPYFTAPGKVDPGRFAGLKDFRTSLYTRVGAHSDAPDHPSGQLTAKARSQHKDWGAFRVPSLREAANTAPYMHNGSIADLPDVVRHYSEINQERLHVDGIAILKPLGLSEREIDDLVAFLESLSSPMDALAQSAR